MKKIALWAMMALAMVSTNGCSDGENPAEPGSLNESAVVALIDFGGDLDVDEEMMTISTPDGKVSFDLPDGVTGEVVAYHNGTEIGRWSIREGGSFEHTFEDGTVIEVTVTDDGESGTAQFTVLVPTDADADGDNTTTTQVVVPVINGFKISLDGETAIEENLTVSETYAVSVDIDHAGVIEAYSWKVNGTVVSTDSDFWLQASVAGQKVISLTVYYDGGKEVSGSKTVMVEEPADSGQPGGGA